MLTALTNAVQLFYPTNRRSYRVHVSSGWLVFHVILGHNIEFSRCSDNYKDAKCSSVERVDGCVYFSVPRLRHFFPSFIQARNESKALAMLGGEERLKGAAALDLVVGDICDMSSLRPAVFKVNSKRALRVVCNISQFCYRSVLEDLCWSRRPEGNK